MDCVVAVPAVVGAVVAMAKPPNEGVVVFWLGAAWPKLNTFWLAACGSGCVALNVKEPLLEAVVAAGGTTEDELVLVVEADQFPKREFTVGWAAVCVTVTGAVEAVPVGALVMTGKMDAVTVVLLAEPPNKEDVLVEETAEVGLVVVREAGCPKLTPAVEPPKMGLKLWTEGLLSGAAVAEELVVVVVTAKMGLNPEDSRGLALLTEPELLAGTPTVTGLEADKVGGALAWLVNPNGVAAATGVLLEG